MGWLIELYNIFIKPEAYGAILLMLI
jgi:hypothetical protein